MNESVSEETSPKREENDLVDEERREALKKLGKYAAYTTPVMLTLLLPKRSLADSARP